MLFISKFYIDLRFVYTFLNTKFQIFNIIPSWKEKLNFAIMPQCCDNFYVLLNTFYIKNGKQRCKFVALSHELTYFVEYGGTQKMMSLVCWSSLHYIILSSLEGTFIQQIIGILMGTRTFWRYQRGNQNPYIEEEQKTQWTKEKVQKDKQRSTKHTHKTKDRVTRTTLKT